ncbi:Probable ATP-dependent RNA helicase DDX28 [Anthophora plagiata]
MLFRFYGHLSRKNADASFMNVSRHYAKAVANARRKENVTIDNQAKNKKGRIPIITCKNNIYNFYKGDTFNKKQPMLVSRGWKSKNSRGDHFVIHPYSNNDQEEIQNDSETFKDLNLSSSTCNILESHLNIHKPLEIQTLGIPKILQGHNVLLAAETGCGKTLAYLLPLIDKILEWKQVVQRDMNTPLGLIVTPSRELTVQIALELIKLTKHLNIKIKLITGGRTKRVILDPPVGHVDILVGSFGVVSKLSTFGVYNLKFVRFVVLDEADALFHYTFDQKLKVFLEKLPIGYFQEISQNGFPNTAQLILVSATIPQRLENVLSVVVNPQSLQHVTTEKLHKILVPQKFMRVISSQKPVELLKYIKPKVLSKQRVIVFTNHNSTSYWLYAFLQKCGINATNLNGDMPLHVRQGKYGEFLNGKTLVLSTTNGGSRGLDTLMVNHILNYDFPLDTAAYIHRCGRTGRVGTVGDSKVTNFICRQAEAVVVQKIEMAARKMTPIPIFNLLERGREAGEEKEEEEEEEEEPEYMNEIIENLENSENIPY